MDVNEYQIGGSHYGNGDYQPWDFIIDSDMHYLFGCVFKYAVRWKDKGGLQDLRKAAHYLAKAEDEYVIYGKYDHHVKMLVINPSYYAFYNAIPKPERDIITAILLDDLPTAQRTLSALISENED